VKVESLAQSVNKNLLVYDNYIQFTDAHYRELSSLKYSWGERDTRDSLPTGLVSGLEPDSLVFKSIFSFVQTLEDLNFQGELRLTRAYCNLFAPSEQPHFHKDIEPSLRGLTVLGYGNREEVDWDEGGETKFIINNELVSIAPKRNRIVVFDSDILHTATTFRTIYRFTPVLKFIIN